MFLFYVWENRLRKLSNLPEWLNRDQVSLTSAAFMDYSVIWMKKVLSEAQVSWGYSNKVPPLRGLNNRNSLSQFWWLEVWDQSLRSRCLLGWFPLKAVRENLFCVLSLGFWVPQAFLGLQMAFFLCVSSHCLPSTCVLSLCPKICILWGHQLYGIRDHPNYLVLTWLPP